MVPATALKVSSHSKTRWQSIHPLAWPRREEHLAPAADDGDGGARSARRRHRSYWNYPYRTQHPRRSDFQLTSPLSYGRNTLPTADAGGDGGAGEALAAGVDNAGGGNVHHQLRRIGGQRVQQWRVTPDVQRLAVGRLSGTGSQVRKSIVCRGLQRPGGPAAARSPRCTAPGSLMPVGNRSA